MNAREDHANWDIALVEKWLGVKKEVRMVEARGKRQK